MRIGFLILSVIASSCAPSLPSLPSGSTDVAACSMASFVSSADRMYILLEAPPTGNLPGFGASLFSRPAAVVLRLSGDGSRVQAQTDLAGIGLAGFSAGSLIRVSADRAHTEMLDASSLALESRLPPMGSVLAPCADGRFVWAASPSGYSLWRMVAPGRAERVFESVQLGSNQECGVAPVALLVRERDLLLGGVCRAQRNATTRFSVVLQAEGAAEMRVLPTPADEYDAPYAVSHNGDMLFVAKPTAHRAWGIRLRDGQVVWQAGYGTAPPRTKQKRIFGPNSILVSPDDATLYVSTAALPGTARGIWVLDARDGSVRTQLVPDLPVTGTALSTDGKTLFVTTPQDGGSVIAIDTATGRAEFRIRELSSRTGGRRTGIPVGILLWPLPR